MDSASTPQDAFRNGKDRRYRLLDVEGPRFAVYLPKRLSVVEHRELELLAHRADQTKEESSNVLVLAATEQPVELSRLPGLDFVTIPSLQSCADGAKSLCNVSDRDRHTLGLRSSVLQATLEAYAPDVLIVSRLPRGIGDELLPALVTLRSNSDVHIVLELNVDLEGSYALQREWREFGYAGVIESLYDSVWLRSDDETAARRVARDLPGLASRSIILATADASAGSTQLVDRVRRWLASGPGPTPTYT